MVCKTFLHSVILGLAFAKCFRVGIDWNIHGQLYMHQDHKPLTYSSQVNPKDNLVIYSTYCTETRIIHESNALLPSRTRAVTPKKYLSHQNKSRKIHKFDCKSLSSDRKPMSLCNINNLQVCGEAEQDINLCVKPRLQRCKN